MVHARHSPRYATPSVVPPVGEKVGHLARPKLDAMPHLDAQHSRVSPG
jgi:hypothetical protein